jgi:hypothetical protein
MVDAEIERAAGEYHRHEPADREDEEKHLQRTEHLAAVERPNLASRGVLDTVEPVDRREQEVAHPVADIERRGNLLERAGDRAAARVELVLARGDEACRHPHGDEHQREDGDWCGKAAILYLTPRPL